LYITEIKTYESIIASDPVKSAMSSLTVLNDAEVKSIFYHLTRDEVEKLQKTLRDALHEYSTNANNDKEGCSFQQPERQQLDRKNGTTTLFMPSTSSSGIGMKGMGLTRMD
jgi:hypothetical protein